MWSLICRSTPAVVNCGGALRLRPHKKPLRRLLTCCCVLGIAVFIYLQPLRSVGLQSGRQGEMRRVPARSDRLSLSNFKAMTSGNYLESRREMTLSRAESLISFSSDEGYVTKPKFVAANEEKYARSKPYKSSSVDHQNQSYVNIVFNVEEDAFDETLSEEKESDTREKDLRSLLPGMSVKEEYDINSSKVIVQFKPTTWLQVIRIGMVQRNPEYLKKHVQVMPYAMMPNPELLNTKSTSLKKILYWNKFYESPDFDFGEGREPFVAAGCPVDACYVTGNRSLFPPEELDAVIWHGRDEDQSLPPERHPHTRYVFFMAESPAHIYLDFGLYKNVFNYTMTYRPDSDVYNPYGFFTLLQRPALDLLTKNFASGKTRMAAWFVSHCRTDSRRETLVQNLQKYITVDVFGKCGTKSCPKQKDQNPDECFRLVERKYKFYFAFENSLCDNYITEKFFGAARFDILPVVYGLGAYEDLAPAHSFINVLDFPSIRHLADYLKYLDQNHTAYNEYFRWKVNYKAVMRYKAMVTKEYNEISWCQLCNKLHSDTSITIYEDLNNWRRRYNCIDSDLPLFSKLVDGEDVSTI